MTAKRSSGRKRAPAVERAAPRRRVDGRAFAGLIAVFAIKFTVMWQLHDHILLGVNASPDTAAYVELARQVIAGNFLLGPGLYYVSPLYIYVVALGLGAFGSLTAVKLIQVVLGTAAVACVFTMTREWFGARAAWIAAALATLTGVITFYESVVLQAAIDPFLSTVGLWAATFALTRGGARWWTVAGIAFGLEALNRPNMAIAVVLFALVLVISRRWQPALRLAAGVLIGISPLLVRNLVVVGQFSMTSSHGGLNLLIGNGEGANGYFRAIPGVSPLIEGQTRDTRRVAEQATGRPLSDAEVSGYFSNLALTWIREHPRDWAILLAKKLWYTFNAHHFAAPLSYPFYAQDAGTLLRVLVVGPWLLIPLGVTGVVFAATRARRSDLLIWFSFVIACAASIVAFFVVDRYRLPMFVALCVTSGGMIDTAWTWMQARQIAALARSAALIVALAVIVNWPVGLTDGDGRGEERVRMATEVARRGRVVEAEQWLTRALETYPYTSLAEYRVGVELGNAQQWGPAAVHLTRALALDPGAPRLELALGQVLAGGGRDAEAVPHLRRAIAADPGLALKKYELAVVLANTGDLAAARIELQSLAPPADTTVDQLLALGQLAMELDAPAIAEPFFARAVSAAPRSALAQRALADVKARLKK